MVANAVAEQTQQQSHPARVAAIRRFNRFYTRQVGALNEGLLHSSLSLSEVRVLYEIAHRQSPTAAELGRDLQLDGGYLSRLLRALEQRTLIERAPSPTDGRQSLLRLTPSGRATFEDLDQRSSAEVATLLAPLTDVQQRRLLEAMRTIETTLGAEARESAPYVLRSHRPGDMGWIVHRQAVLYAQEYGWNEEYEGLIARIVADFIDTFDAKREHCWIAEREGDIIGSVFVVRHPQRDGVAKLRLLYVEPAARGMGLGRRLVSEVTRFARDAGYRAISLWTNSVLVSARRLYEAEGYRLVHEEPHHSFGHDLIGETWELEL
jgi:DNA-binding MarR family transcriptional regulator/GNAT superfamily N-acetyltransferase